MLNISVSHELYSNTSDYVNGYINFYAAACPWQAAKQSKKIILGCLR